MTPTKKKHISYVCSVVGCKNNSINAPGTQFYRFPTMTHKKPQRHQWINAVKRMNPDGTPWEPKKHSRICSQHFTGNKKSEHPLHPSFVPTIFPNVYRRSNPPGKAAIERLNRRMKRQAAHDVQVSPIKSSKKVRTVSGNEGTEIPVVHFEPESAQNPHFLQKDQETQVDFLESAETINDCKVFISNRFVHDGISEAETQTCIPPADRIVKMSTTKIRSVDKCCGESVTYRDTAAGPDVADLDENSMVKCRSGFHGLSSITKDQEMLDLCGVTLGTFALLLKIFAGSTRTKMSQESRLLIFLFKMKLGLTYSALSVLFQVHRSTISRNFFATLQFLSNACATFVRWPSKEVVQSTMPTVFKDTFKNCRVIIDCTEIKVEQPPTVEDRVHFYSHYKKGFTAKILVGCTPRGFISFVSKCHGGRTTDAQITTTSGFLDLLEPGDTVLADKGFPGIKTALDNRGNGILIVMPPFLRNNEFSAEEVHETYNVARVRIHIERIMQRLKTYNILSKFTIDMLPHCDDIVFMTCALVNLQPCIIRENDD